jgi:hypothetical protein
MIALRREVICHHIAFRARAIHFFVCVRYTFSRVWEDENCSLGDDCECSESIRALFWYLFGKKSKSSK